MEDQIRSKRPLEAVLESSSWLQESPWTTPRGSRGVLESSRERLGERLGTILDQIEAIWGPFLGLECVIGTI